MACSKKIINSVTFVNGRTFNVIFFIFICFEKVHKCNQRIL